jgi:hypothetical protein
VQSLAAQSAALSAARWAADRAHSPARQLAPRPAPLSLRKRRHGLADIIGGAAPVITLSERCLVDANGPALLRLLSWPLPIEQSRCRKWQALSSIRPRFWQVAAPWMNCDRTVMLRGAKGG